MVPCRVRSRSRRHGTMWVITRTFRACRSARTSGGSRRKTRGVEVEGGLRRVPPGWRESRAEVDDRVERHPLLAEGVDHPGEDLLRGALVVTQFPVRLHVAERPLRGHDRRARDVGDVPHKGRGVACVEDEGVEYVGGLGGGGTALHLPLVRAILVRDARDERRRTLPGNEGSPLGLTQVDVDPRRGDVEPPPLGADQQCNRVARSVGVGLPARTHLVEAAAPVELDRVIGAPALARLGAALAHAEHRVGPDAERDCAVVREPERLDGRTVGTANLDRKGRRADRHVEVPDPPRHGCRQPVNGDDRGWIAPSGGERRRERQRIREAQRLEGDADAVLAGGPDLEPTGLAATRADLLGGGWMGPGGPEAQEERRKCKPHFTSCNVRFTYYTLVGPGCAPGCGSHHA